MKHQYRSFLLSFIIIALGIISCDFINPLFDENGSLALKCIINKNQLDKTSDISLSLTIERIRCIIYKSGSVKKDFYLTKDDNKFKGSKKLKRGTYDIKVAAYNESNVDPAYTGNASGVEVSPLKTTDVIIILEPTEVTLTTSVNPSNAGNISKNLNKAKYNYGETVQLTASPASGYQFDHWDGDLSGSSNPNSIILNGNKNVIAVFKQQKVETPTFNPPEGNYTSAQNITITCATPGATIHYTINGIDPSESDPIYSAAVLISATTTLKARAYKTNWMPSDVKNGLYTIKEKVATPTFNPSEGTFTSIQYVTIACATSGATIHYTINGIDPTESDPIYSAPIPISSTTTLKARAYKMGWTPSDVTSVNIFITGKVATPTFTLPEGTFTSAQNVTITCATSGATIRYTTNGIDPTESSLSYSAPILISATTTLKARAYKTDWTPSDVKSGLYTITGKVTTPTFNPPEGSYASAQNVTITCATSGATIHYTINGIDPTESDPIYSTPIPISVTTTLKAKAYKTDWTPSDVKSGLYIIPPVKVATPTFNPPEGTYTSAQNVTITCATSGTTIRYTTNGIDPAESDPIYSTPILISATTTLKARAYKTGWTSSDVKSGLYNITGKVVTPAFNPPEGTYTSAQNVTITCATSGATIHYTINGIDPTESDPIYSAPIPISVTTTLKARAYKTDWMPSEVKSGIYIIGPVGLVAYYPFNGNANDESGKGNNGTVYGGATLTTDRFNNPNKAYNFDGIDDYILVPNSNSLNIKDALTISAWVNFPSIPSGGSHILMKSDHPDTYEYGFSLNNVHNNELSANIGGYNVINATSDPTSVNTWYHILATWQYPGRCDLYINGVLDTSVTTIGNIDPLNCPFTIGRIRPGASGAYYNGIVDDIRIYNRVLSVSEIQILYHEGGW